MFIILGTEENTSLSEVIGEGDIGRLKELPPHEWGRYLECSIGFNRVHHR
jgi:hypothetical protein